MKKKESDTKTQETEKVAEREKVGEGAIRKMGKQGGIAIKPKPVQLRDTQEREGQRRMTKERNIKTENTFSVLQEEDIKPLRKEKKSPQIVKTEKDEKKIYEGKGRRKIRKAYRERKGECETSPKSGLPKNYSNKGTQN